MALIIEAIDLPGDLASHAMAATWVSGANARASRVAPCLAATDPAQPFGAAIPLTGGAER